MNSINSFQSLFDKLSPENQDYILSILRHLKSVQEILIRQKENAGIFNIPSDIL